MRGLSCGACSHANKPYVTAYEIALKHGFQGTEEEWINTIGCIYLAKVTREASGDWDCGDKFTDLLAIAPYKELHLLTLDGRIAFLNGYDDNHITFCTTSYEADAGTVYDKYVLYASGDGSLETIDVSDETGTITIDRLASGIQTSLGKADTAYQKPSGGIRFEDLQSSVQESIQAAETIVITIVKDGDNYSADLAHTDLHGYQSLLHAVIAGADIRMQYSPVEYGSPVVMHPYIGTVNSNNALLFGGVEEYTDFEHYESKIAFYALELNGTVHYREWPVLDKITSVDEIQYYDVVVSYDGNTFSCNKNFSDIQTAYSSNKLIRFFYKTFHGSLIEVTETAIFFSVIDITTPAAPEQLMIVITSSGITGLPLIT